MVDKAKWMVRCSSNAGSYCSIKRNKKVLYTTVIIIVCILVSEVVLRAQKYDPMPPCIKYVAGFQDMLGVYYSRGIRRNTNSFINETIDESFVREYSPYYSYYDSWVEPLNHYEDVSGFIRNYLNAFFRNPIPFTVYKKH